MSRIVDSLSDPGEAPSIVVSCSFVAAGLSDLLTVMLPPGSETMGLDAFAALQSGVWVLA